MRGARSLFDGAFIEEPEFFQPRRFSRGLVLSMASRKARMEAREALAAERASWCDLASRSARLELEADVSADVLRQNEVFAESVARFDYREARRLSDENEQEQLDWDLRSRLF